jgi:hypothetical protein
MARYENFHVNKLMADSINGYTFPGGVGAGRALHVVPAVSSTSYYREFLEQNNTNPDDMFLTLAAAYASAKANRNDVIYVYPGLYTTTSVIDWTKDHTHLVGVGTKHKFDRSAEYNLLFYSDTAAQEAIIHMAGDYCMFENVSLQNGLSGGSATAANVAALMLAGHGNHFKGVVFRGMHSATQAASDECTSLSVMAGGRGCLFEDCTFGHQAYGIKRTNTNSGHVRIDYDTADLPNPSNMVFKDCLFLSRDTGTVGTDSDLPAVMHCVNVAADRLWLFDNCYFDSWADNWGNRSAQVFKNSGSVTTSNFRLHNCGASGYTSWTASQHGYGSAGTWWLESDMPITGTGGGLSRSAVGAAGA